MRAIKICIVIFFVLTLVSTGISVYLSFVRENEKALRIKAEEDIAQLENTNAKLMTRIGELSTKNKTLTEDVNKKDRIIDSYKTKLRNEKQEKEEARDRADRLEQEMKRLKSEYSTFKLDNTNLLNEYKDRNQALLDKIRYLESKSSQPNDVTTMTRETAVVTPAIDLEPVVVRPTKSISGRIEVVNRKFNFVISNVGKNDGLEIGDRLKVFRNGMQVGEVRVEKLYDKLSASAIEKENPNNLLREGDVVGY